MILMLVTTYKTENDILCNDNILLFIYNIAN